MDFQEYSHSVGLWAILGRRARYFRILFEVRDQLLTSLTSNRILNLTMPLNYDKWNALEVHTDQIRKCMDSEWFAPPAL